MQLWMVLLSITIKHLTRLYEPEMPRVDDTTACVTSFDYCVGTKHIKHGQYLNGNNTDICK
jgi:hypothetical protein